MESTDDKSLFIPLMAPDLTDMNGTNDNTDVSQEPGQIMESLGDLKETEILGRSQSIKSSWNTPATDDDTVRPDRQQNINRPDRQEILLKGDDNQNSYAICGCTIEVMPSEASGATQAPVGSNKVKINPVVNFDWEHKYYIGNLVTVHLNQTHIAYVLRGKSGGIVRVTNRKTAERHLLKNFVGRVVDISFAFTSRVILGIVDEPGNMYIYEITEGSDGKLGESMLLQMMRPAGTPPTDFHRLIWCSYIPEDNSSTDCYYNDSMLLLLTHNETAEVWHVGKVSRDLDSSTPLLVSQVTSGFYEIHIHTQPIIDAVFSPDGTALATASLDGDVIFFQFDITNDVPPKVIHRWQPHGGNPLSCLFFLDDRKNLNSDVQLWKFAITGANHNSELKLWSCHNWTCQQSIHFCMAPSSLSLGAASEARIKACLDLSASYLVLSDINRTVLYILDLSLDKAEFCSLTEFILMQPCLSFSILDAGRRRLVKETLDYGAENIWPCTTGEVGNEENDEDVPLSVNQPDVGVLVRLYSIHTRAMQELQVRYKPSSFPKSVSESTVSTDLAAGPHDYLSDAASEFDRAADLLSSHDRSIQTQRSPNNDSLTSLDTSVNRSISSQQPLLLTPDAFISPRRPESLASSVSESLTLVTAIDDDATTPCSIPSNSFRLGAPGTPLNSSRSMEARSADITGSNEIDLLDSSSVEPSSPLRFSTLKIESVSTTIPVSMSVAEGVSSPSIDNMFLRRIGERSHLLSSGSSSSASQEVTEILESQNRLDTSNRLAESLIDKEDEYDEQARNDDSVSEDDTQISKGDGGKEEREDDDDDDNENANVVEDVSIQPMEEKIESRQSQDWPQAAGVINVDELIQKTQAAQRKSFEHELCDVDPVSVYEINKSFDPLTKDPVNRLQETINSDIKDNNSYLEDQLSSAPNELSYREVKKLMVELIELVRQQRDEIRTLQSEVRQQKSWTESVNHLQSQVDSMSEHLNTRMTQILSEHTQTQSEQLFKTIQGVGVQNHLRYEDLAPSLFKTIQDSVSQQLDRILHREIQSNLIPCLEKSLEPMKEQFHVELAQRLTPMDSVLKDTIGRVLRSKTSVEAISQAAANEMHNSLGTLYQNIVIPSLDRSCQDLMHQMATLFKNGSEQYLQHLESCTQQTQKNVEEAHRRSAQRLQGITDAFHHTEGSQREVEGQLVGLVGKLQSCLSQIQHSQLADEDILKTKFNQLQETLSEQICRIVGQEVKTLLHEQQVVINDQLQNVLRSGTATPVHPFNDIQQQQLQISTLLKQRKYDTAFQLALSATDLTLVEYACEAADPSLVFCSDSPSPLGQAVLLSLIQQLSSADFHTKTELKHRYLEESILNLDQSKSVTREHLPAIVSQLCNKLSIYIRTADPSDQMLQPMSRLHRLCELLMRASGKQP